MSLWEQEHRIGFIVDPEANELLLSASDVVAWLRDRSEACAEVPALAHETPALTRAADALVGGWLTATRPLLDGSGS